MTKERDKKPGFIKEREERDEKKWLQTIWEQRFLFAQLDGGWINWLADSLAISVVTGPLLNTRENNLVIYVFCFVLFLARRRQLWGAGYRLALGLTEGCWCPSISGVSSSGQVHISVLRFLTRKPLSLKKNKASSSLNYLLFNLLVCSSSIYYFSGFWILTIF